MIKLNLENNIGKKANFEADSLTAREAGSIIHQIITYMNADEMPGRIRPEQISTAARQTAESITAIPQKDDVEKNTDKAGAADAREATKTVTNRLAEKAEPAEKINSRPRQVQLLNSERRLATPIVFPTNDKGEREKWKTRFSCPSCGLSETKHVPQGFRFTPCDNCGTRVQIKPANAAWGQEDSEGFVYRANNFYEEKKEERYDA
ncbi:hypothetical protein ACWGRE_13425 [Bacillus velezensis]|uniref:hypothetical protein n=1 Tax=Bacillus amyloliquefaciens TaxID=1390 RepID=UPI000E59B25E|nr:hypothetical protein [Bacillus amyloliquefaciens]MCM3250446.1 hypothetical protein [Bacillus amyloliquefaciens]MCY7426879.1 hypothetical protein [Bacillus amyloliquefaciens]MEC0965450.1 hypothetical protein [Bacillus amyloliquefaciens]MEC1013077.1 hypothetical protein [Bacillus amyloliquefaciens]MEC2262537.1 hypothetical protein [Bacillus amyloliquefaciens]